jgi:hypothetical protein
MVLRVLVKMVKWVHVVHVIVSTSGLDAPEAQVFALFVP